MRAYSTGRGQFDQTKPVLKDLWQQPNINSENTQNIWDIMEKPKFIIQKSATSKMSHTSRLHVVKQTCLIQSLLSKKVRKTEVRNKNSRTEQASNSFKSLNELMAKKQKLNF